MQSFGLCERFTPGFVLGRGRAQVCGLAEGRIRGAVWLEQPENLQTGGPSWLWIRVCWVSVGWSVLSFPFWVSERKWKPAPLKWISRIWIYWAVCPFQTKSANSCPCPRLPVESWLVTPLAFVWCRLHDMTPVPWAGVLLRSCLVFRTPPGVRMRTNLGFLLGKEIRL